MSELFSGISHSQSKVLCLETSMSLGLALFSVPVALLLRLITVERKLRTSQEENKLLHNERMSERQGRIRAEKKLREATIGGGKEEGNDAYPLKHIGLLRSCFSQRNGTPRQPLLVSSAISVLTLRKELSADFLEGLEGFSHCWVLYMFHQNTDFQKVWDTSYVGVRGKIRVPRKNGEKLGVFSTRSPHRPCPIGLSVARIVSVKGNTVTFAGADIVDGSPVLDIKPYVPFCDHVPTAFAPHWVDSEIEDDPLQSMDVHVSPQALQDIENSWRRNPRSLYDSFEAVICFIKEVLSRDFRSVTQRIKVPKREEQGLQLAALHGNVPGPQWHVILDGMDICYDIEMDNHRLVVYSCQLI
jgi:tRNA-Thr(GGU) m(6)t(6)A37 methyltransferase TsaA